MYRVGEEWGNNASHFNLERYNLSPGLFDEIGGVVTNNEISQALFAMPPAKAPGLDGFHAMFFQQNWDIVGSRITQVVKDIFNTVIIPEHLNETFICLFPKEKVLWKSPTLGLLAYATLFIKL